MMYKWLVYGTGNLSMEGYVVEIIKYNKKVKFKLSEILREIAPRFPGALEERFEMCNTWKISLKLSRRTKKFVKQGRKITADTRNETVSDTTGRTQILCRLQVEGKKQFLVDKETSNKTQKKIECFNCGGNHYRSKCPKLVEKKKENSSPKTAKTGFTALNERRMCYLKGSLSVGEVRILVDTGASHSFINKPLTKGLKRDSIKDVVASTATGNFKVRI